jgi:hypothetical protein
LVIETRDFRGNHHIEGRRQRRVLAREFRAVFVEGDMIIIGLATARLKSRRPDLVALHVTQKNIGAKIIAGRVFAPAGDRELAPTAVAGAGAGQHRGIDAVGQQMRGRRRMMRGGEASSAQGFDVAPFFSRGLHFRRPGMRNGDIARQAFLQ